MRVADKKTANLHEQFDSIYDEARRAGLEAVDGMNVIPMIVQQHANMADDSSPVVKNYFAEGGVCGFAWITVKPGNPPFANWLKKNGLGRKDSYYGGVTIWVDEFDQSMQRKEKYAHAFAKVLNDHGITARAMSRLD
jgi:hypothetical protein